MQRKFLFTSGSLHQIHFIREKINTSGGAVGVVSE